MGREVEVPCEAVYTAKDDTENGEDDHAGEVIAFSAWGIERRNVGSTGTDFVGSDNLKGGSECKGCDKEYGEEGTEDE